MQRYRVVQNLFSTSHRWLSSVLAIVMLTAGSSCLGAKQPNVLMIVVDDMNDWVSCLGAHPQIQTPNIDRLAQRGVLFSNAHVPAPVCNHSFWQPASTDLICRSMLHANTLTCTRSIRSFLLRSKKTIAMIFR